MSRVHASVSRDYGCCCTYCYLGCGETLTIIYLIYHHSRAVNNDFMGQKYDSRSMELATVVMRLGGPVLLKVIRKA